MGGRQISREVLDDGVKAFLLDLDGTVYSDAGPIPGTIEALASLESRGVPFRFITNTTRSPRSRLVKRLRNYGFPAEAADVFTAVLAGAAVLEGSGASIVAPFVEPETLEDLAAFELSGGVAPHSGRPDAVLLGDLGDGWTVSMLNEAFRYVMDGAALIALQKNRYWKSGDELRMDSGPFVAAVEYATGREAVVCGKPQREFFRAAASGLGVSHSQVAMVGDDLWGDVAGAQEAGMKGWLVRTGKFRQDQLDSSGIEPDRVIESAAHLSDPA